MTENIFDLIRQSELSDVDTCKGLFWRGSQSAYLSSYRSFEHRKSLRLLKRLSCPGCSQCEWVWEYLGEEAPYLDDIIPGKIYTYHVSSSQGYYDEYPEVDSIDFVEVKQGEML